MKDGITLAPIREEDAESFCRMANRPEVIRWLPDFRMTLTLAEKLARESRETAFLSPREQPRLYGIYEGDALRGALSLGPVYETGYRPSLGFFLSREAEGRGVASRAVELAMAILGREGAESLFALTETGNHRAARVLESRGFEKIGTRSFRPAGEREKRRYDLWERKL